VTELPETRATLLARLEDHRDRDAWNQFTAIYSPAIYRIARQRGLQDADARDLTQGVLMAVAAAIPEFEHREEGGFRRWLRRVARNAAINALTRRPLDRAAGGSALVDLMRAHPADDDHAGQAIDWESRREIYRQAARRVRTQVSSETWQIFARTAVDGADPQRVAEETGKTIGTVYVAKCRVMKRLRAAAAELEEAQS